MKSYKQLMEEFENDTLSTQLTNAFVKFMRPIKTTDNESS